MKTTALLKRKKMNGTSFGMKICNLVSFILVLCLATCATAPAFASDSLEDIARTAVIDDFDGIVKAIQDENEIGAFKGLALLRRNWLDTSAESWSRLEFDKGRFALVEENTNIQIAALADELTKGVKTTQVYISDGKVWFDVSKEFSEGESFEVKTPNCALSVRGTVFSVAADGENETDLVVYDGKVVIRAEQEGGTPLLDSDGNEVIVEVISSKVKISLQTGKIPTVMQGKLTMEDLIPFQEDGGDGAGGVYAALRGHMQSNQQFMQQIEQLVKQELESISPAEVQQIMESLKDKPALPQTPQLRSIPIPRVPVPRQSIPVRR